MSKHSAAESPGDGLDRINHKISKVIFGDRNRPLRKRKPLSKQQETCCDMIVLALLQMIRIPGILFLGLVEGINCGFAQSVKKMNEVLKGDER